MTESEELEPAIIIENKFEDAKTGRETRVVREMEGALAERYIEILDEDGVWRDFEELRSESDNLDE